MQQLIKRPQYIKELLGFKDKQLIKVVTGIRRAGKSTLFDLYIAELLKMGIKQKQILRLNLEEPEYHELDDYMKLYEYIKARLQKNEMNYVFIDEVQNVPDFQKAVDGVFVQKKCDVYITGSNARILSGELATLLSGRYVEIKMLPLSFSEYISVVGESNILLKYRNYLENSSFPYTLALDDKKNIRTYLAGIYDSIILKDVVARSRISNVSQLENVVRFMFDNIGNLCSARKIANALCSAGHKISVHTLENQLKALCESFILYRAGRYDIKGKEYLQTQSKYYLSDIGLRYYLLGSKKADSGHILENIVYLELLRRGYEVYIGKVASAEIDFIAIGKDGEEYYQVAYTLEDAETLKRELAPLAAIRDHNPKFLLTADFAPNCSHNGIKQVNVFEWLLGDDVLF